jgi:monoamine oxidase
MPASVLPHPRVALAGDWLDAEFPATLEAAVRTGFAAGAALDRRGFV